MESINDALKNKMLDSSRAIQLCTEMKVSYENMIFKVMLS